MFNLFNQDNVTNITTRYNRNGSVPSALATQLYDGTIGDVTRFVSAPGGASPSYNPIYNQPLGYQEGRRINLGVRFQF